MVRRVCITGIGIVSPAGNHREATWRRVAEGRSCAAPITQFDASAWTTRFACEVRDFVFPRAALDSSFDDWRTRANEFGLASALEAMQDSGIEGHIAPERFGVSVGVGIGTITPTSVAGLLGDVDMEHLVADLARALEKNFDRNFLARNHPGILSALIASRWNAAGPHSTVYTACTSSGQSIGQAFLQIQRGEADAVIAGGSDSIAGELYHAAFCLLSALSKRNSDPQTASRPFDKDRDGFVPSEGAAMLVLEEREHALARGAKIWGEILSYGDTANAWRITDLPEDGAGIVAAMEQAVSKAGISWCDIDYVNAHGTSTPLNDRIEAAALDRVFSTRGAFPWVSSTKSVVGHLISAAGALELAFCCLAMRDGVIPPTQNLMETDCSKTLRFVAREPRKADVKIAMSNLLGFGGSNAVLIVRK
jgi:3-oxoacyl-[acyl-carrier-protein] synthase II